MWFKIISRSSSPSPPATIQGNLSALSCYDAVINSYEDIYNLSGIAGQTVHIDFSSTAFETFLYMEAVHTDYVSHISTSGISRHTIDYTFPTTRTYKLEVETLYGPGDSSAHSGPYTLVVSTGGSPSPGQNVPSMPPSQNHVTPPESNSLRESSRCLDYS